VDDAEFRAAVNARAARICSWICLGMALTVSVIVIGTWFVMTPQFRTMFEDMQIAGGMPPLTLLAMGWWFPALVAVLAALGTAKEFLVTNTTVCLVLSGLHLAAVVVIGAAYRMGLFLPLLKLIEGIG